MRETELENITTEEYNRLKKAWDALIALGLAAEKLWENATNQYNNFDKFKEHLEDAQKLVGESAFLLDNQNLNSLWGPFERYKLIKGKLIAIKVLMGEEFKNSKFEDISESKKAEFEQYITVYKSYNKTAHQDYQQELIFLQKDLAKKMKAIRERLTTADPEKINLMKQFETGITEIKIRQELFFFINKPKELKGYLKRVLRGNWPQEKKDRWQDVIIEVMEDYYEEKWYKKIGKAALEIAAKITGEAVVEGLVELGRWGFAKLVEYLKDKKV